jgi:alpha-beta hydrolase superfamily lysophospholipase
MLTNPIDGRGGGVGVGDRFPVGYHALHPDVALNFQLNRFWNWVGEDRMLAQLRDAASRIVTYDDWTRELLALGDQALTEARPLPAAYFFRMAEFFMPANDPRKRPLRQRFIELARQEHQVDDEAHHVIPYDEGLLSAYRFTTDSPTGRIVVFGGFDSYIEEWFPFGLALRDHGLEVVAFDGPGQGAALEAGVPMTAEWQRPVAAVLDHFDLDDVALMGFSLGGGLVMHAAAHEPRVRRVIAQDILSDFTECYARPLGTVRGAFVTHATQLPAGLVDAVIGAARRNSMFADWGVREGMRVFGVDHPAALLEAMRTLRTDAVSPLVEQDVLLMAGRADHYVPFSQLGDQITTLTRARSVTARVFTEAEQAQNHVQVGNLGLALRVIVDWLDSVTGRERA